MTSPNTSNFKVSSFKRLSLILALTAIGVMRSHACFGQYFPGPAPVPARLENTLKNKLNNEISGINRLEVLLQLTNLFYNKSSKDPRNLNEGLTYANQSIQLSNQLHNVSAYNEAQLLKADILIDQDKMQEAENILSLINDTTKVNLLLTLTFKYANSTTGQTAKNQDSAMYYVKLAKTLAIKLHEKINAITCLKYLGSIHAGQGKLDLGEEELQEAITAYKAAGYEKLHYTYLELLQLD